MRRVILLLPLLWSASFAMSTMASKNCAVVGVGVLGTSLCRQILESPEFAGCTVTGITKTSNRHAEIREHVGAENSHRLRLVTAEERGDDKYENVVFCAPPSGFEDYPGAVKDAVDKIWVGPEKGGVFVFTSTGAVYV
jgi:pyrroline-5-carboxylate reductase